MQNNNNTITTYLEIRNKEDTIYQRLKNIENTTDIKLQKKITYIYNNKTKIKKLLGMLNKYYKDGYTLTDYYLNIATILGGGDIEKGKNIFNDNLNKIATEHMDILGEEHTTVKHLMLVQILYKSYIGFCYEDIIREIIHDTNLFNINTSSELDIKSKIDILVNLKEEQYKHIRIGLQLKALTYKDISTTYKREHIKGNISAIKGNICAEVKYLLHNKDGNIIQIGTNILQNKEDICNNVNMDREITIVTAEQFIKELIEIIKNHKEKTPTKPLPMVK